MLSSIDVASYLQTGKIEAVLASGERLIQHEVQVRPTEYIWLKGLSDICKQTNTYFKVMRIGQNFKTDRKLLEEHARCFRSEVAKSLMLDNEVSLYFKEN